MKECAAELRTFMRKSVQADRPQLYIMTFRDGSNQTMLHLGSLCCALKGKPWIHYAAQQGEAGIGALCNATVLAFGLYGSPARGLPCPMLSHIIQLCMGFAEQIHCLQ